MADARGWEFCRTLVTRLVQCRPYDPESKGVVEWANQYLETWSLPRCTVTTPEGFNTQLTDWLTRPTPAPCVAFAPTSRPARPGHRGDAAIAADRARAGWSWQGRLGRDYYVRLSECQEIRAGQHEGVGLDMVDTIGRLSTCE